MGTLGLTLLASCSTKEDIYEQTIADYVQTDQYGIWTDLHFKVVSMDAKECTVTDSIRILQEDARTEIENAIAHETKLLDEYRDELEQNNKSARPSKMIAKMYREKIAFSEQRLDALRKKDPLEIVCYYGLDPDKVLPFM